MENNNFKRLERAEEIPAGLQRRVRNNVDGSIGLLRFVFRIFDLYVPKVFGLVAPVGLEQAEDRFQATRENNTHATPESPDDTEH